MKTIVIFFSLLIVSIVPAQNPPSNKSTVDHEKVARFYKLELERKELEAQKVELSVKYAPEYSRIRQIDQRLDAVKSELASLLPFVTLKAKSISPEAAAIVPEIYSLRAALRLCGISETNCSEADTKQKLADAYQRAVPHPESMAVLLADAIERFDASRESTKSAAQVSQIADEQNAELMRLLVVQNQRIIQLLEQILKKR